jgi:hypothetical protein
MTQPEPTPEPINTSPPPQPGDPAHLAMTPPTSSCWTISRPQNLPSARTCWQTWRRATRITRCCGASRRAAAQAVGPNPGVLAQKRGAHLQAPGDAQIERVCHLRHAAGAGRAVRLAAVLPHPPGGRPARAGRPGGPGGAADGGALQPGRGAAGRRPAQPGRAPGGDHPGHCGPTSPGWRT